MYVIPEQGHHNFRCAIRTVSCFISRVSISLIYVILTFFSPSRSRYAQRLQSNLTWLAAAADHGKQGVSFYFLFSLDPKGPLSLWVGHAFTTRFTVFSHLPLIFFFCRFHFLLFLMVYVSLSVF